MLLVYLFSISKQFIDINSSIIWNVFQNFWPIEFDFRESTTNALSVHPNALQESRIPTTVIANFSTFAITANSVVVHIFCWFNQSNKKANDCHQSDCETFVLHLEFDYYLIIYWLVCVCIRNCHFWLDEILIIYSNLLHSIAYNLPLRSLVCKNPSI